MLRPNFAVDRLARLENRDLQHIIRQFPSAGRSYAEIARLLDTLPSTLESILNSRRIFDSLYDRRVLILNVSPFFFFNVTLRQCWERDHRLHDRRIINYLANLLSLFVPNERVTRIRLHEQETHPYLIDLLASLDQADSRRRFLIQAHIGNYALFLSGLFPHWLHHRHRFRRRPVSPEYYVEMGRGAFHEAARHRMAREFGLDDVFLRMAVMFTHYRDTLNRLSREYGFGAY